MKHVWSGGAPDPPRPPRPWMGPAALALALLLGAILRLIHPADMEYKGDEAWTFQQTQEIGKTTPFPWKGMPTSIHIANPGMSVWIFVAIARVFAIDDPIALARAVQALNVAALFLVVAAAHLLLPREEREPWRWAAALAAVNPLTVLFHRKIWPPSVLPFFVVLLLMCWWRRDTRRGAFGWGLLGTCLGQVHLGGFLLAGGFVLWAFLFDRPRTAWGGWFIGSLLGALPLIPWLYESITSLSVGGAAIHWNRLLRFRFWALWITEPLGTGMRYALGEDFADFLRYPLIGGHPTYLVAVSHVVAVAAGVGILTLFAARAWPPPRHWNSVLIGSQTRTSFTICAAFWGSGLLFTLTRLPFHRHYLIVAFPLVSAWLAVMAIGVRPDRARWRREGRALLLAVWGCCLVVSVCFLHYIHVNGGAPRGDYGLAYSVRLKQQPPPPAPGATAR